MSKRRFAILANCQGTPTKNLLAQYIKEAEFLDIKPVHLIDKKDITKIFKELNSTDFIITQPLSSNFNELEFSNLRKTFKDKLIVFPVIYFSGYNPEMIYFRNFNGSSFRNFIMDYHDIFILCSYIRKKQKESIIELFYSSNELLKNICKTIWTKSLHELESRERNCDILISDLIKSSTGTKLFHTVNHPSNTVIKHVVKQVLKLIKFDSSNTIHDFTGLENIQIPSYYSVKNEQKFQDNSNYLIKKIKYSKSDMIDRYYEYYNIQNKEILEYNFNLVGEQLKSDLLLLVDGKNGNL